MMTALRLIPQEIMRPSDRGTVRPFRRVVRRSVVVIFGLATLLAAATWVISYTGLSINYIRQFDQRTLHVYSHVDPTRITIVFQGVRPYAEPSLQFSAGVGRVRIVSMSRIAEGIIGPNHNLELAGFRLRLWSFNQIRLNKVEFPCWATVLLFSGWPIIAFIRGPYRRAARRAKGLCLKCGYNLTGLVEPRCPECGTAMSPDQVNRRMSVSV